MDNRGLARVLGDIADLLELKGENAFKIRAYRAAADTIGAWPEPVVHLNAAQLRALPGIGKDLAAKLRELGDTGRCAYHDELLQEFPVTLLDLLRLPGVGPKTAAVLYSTLHVRTLDDLAAAARAGRLRTVKGMGVAKEAQILQAIEARRKDAGRHLLAETEAQCARLVAYLEEHADGAEIVPAGSLRRGCETCGNIDLLAVGASAALLDALIAYPEVQGVVARDDRHASVRLRGDYRADLRLVPVASRGAALQAFTGSAAHTRALRERAMHQGFVLNEHGLFRTADDRRVAGETEAGLYEALGLPWIEPELREDRGEIDAALERRLPPRLATADLRGDLHMHTTATDGRDTLEAMAAAAAALGHEYIAVTDHSQALAMANGLDEHRALEHAARVRALNGRFEGLTLLAGIECDILSDGRLDLADDCLAQLDFVIASVHSHFSQGRTQVTDRVLRALECPWVDVLGHPTGRRLLKREPLQLDTDAVLAMAARRGVALEINCHAARLDLNDTLARAAHERGAWLVISTDAHSVAELRNLPRGVQVARRAWAGPGQVLNTRGLTAVRAILRRHRRG